MKAYVGAFIQHVGLLNILRFVLLSLLRELRQRDTRKAGLVVASTKR